MTDVFHLATDYYGFPLFLTYGVGGGVFSVVVKYQFIVVLTVEERERGGGIKANAFENLIFINEQKK